MKNKKGFTLVELLAVIVLISLIMVIVVPQVQKVAKQSKVKLCKSKITLAEEALNLWGQDNYRCFSREDGCNMLDNCDTVDDTIICSVKFNDLAKNNLVNYDQKVNDVDTIINPIDNSSLNNLEFRVKYDSKTKNINSTTSQKIDDICVSVKDNNTQQTTSNINSNTSNEEEKYNLIIKNHDGKFKNNLETKKYSKGTIITIPLDFASGYELYSYSCQNASCQKNGLNLLVTIESADATITIISKEISEQSKFATDSWTAIHTNIKNNNLDYYQIGDIKKIYISNLGYFNVRIANKSTPSECNSTDFSETACGFVIEFVDIVEKRTMNSTNTNLGGWPASEIRAYANNEFFNKLPSDLQNIIINTKVVSGHGSEDSTNFISTDKIYLLSGKEVWDYNGNSETSNSQSRQLDYYKNNGTTQSNYTSAIKSYNNSNTNWQLRGSFASKSNIFWCVDSNGRAIGNVATNNNGFAPVFRIG